MDLKNRSPHIYRIHITKLHSVIIIDCTNFDTKYSYEVWKQCNHYIITIKPNSF